MHLNFEQIDIPYLLRKSSYSRLWYKPNTVFLTPKAYVKIDFCCPCAGNSPESAVLTDIFTRLLMDYLNEYGNLRTILKHQSVTLTVEKSHVDCLCILYYLLFILIISCCIFICIVAKFWKNISHALHRLAYDAQVAGLYYGINNTDNGFQVFFCSFIFLLGVSPEQLSSYIGYHNVPNRDIRNCGVNYFTNAGKMGHHLLTI